jgi:Undecaprenyl-phosphate galactose phosphotransferase WbaP
MTPTLAKRANTATLARHGVQIEFPRLLAGTSRRWKRVFDIVCAALLLLAAAPLFLLIGLAIRLDSPGWVLFAHKRIGQDRRRFRVWKFRTMVQNADRVLEEYLAENPGAALEWDLTHKLKDDPRVTRMGRLLRRTSLDELPQLWNVLKGDMSIVGPRPIVEAEMPKYGPSFALYAQVKPGLTGLWQVSGRNDTSYRRRVELDATYIRNWTPALDVNLLARTVRVVLKGKGAY